MYFINIEYQRARISVTFLRNDIITLQFIAVNAGIKFDGLAMLFLIGTVLKLITIVIQNSS